MRRIPKCFLKSTIHIETGEGKYLKSGDGYFFSFELTTDKVYYSSIITSKKLIANNSKINLFFKTENDGKLSNREYYILTIPNNAAYTIQDSDNLNDLVVIPFYNVSAKLDEAQIKVSPVFLTKEFLPLFKIPISEPELDKMQKMWEARF